MNSKIVTILLFTLVLNGVFAAEQTSQLNQDKAEQDQSTIQLPPKNSPEYWNIRTEAITELLPLLTKKRLEAKTLKKLLEDYLLKINKASDFTSQNIPVPDDPAVYFEILQIGQKMNEMNAPKPKTRPSWDDIMNIAMDYVVFEGYVPTHVEEGEEFEAYIEICQKKEQYGQKVRTDLRTIADQCARMWVYLDKIKKKDEFKASYAALREEQQAQKAQARAQYMEAHRQQMIAEAQQQQEQKFEDAQSRASFSSNRRQLQYEDRQSRREHSQTLLDERFVGSGAYYH